MSPSQVIADKQATHHREKSEEVSHQKVSESDKPNLSASSPKEKNLILLYTLYFCARMENQTLTPLTSYL